MKKILSQCKYRTANIVDYIGEWHSHPKGASSQKSDKDIKQLKEITAGMAVEGLPAVMVIVAEHEISFNIEDCNEIFSY